MLIELTPNGQQNAALVRQALRELEQRALAGVEAASVASAREVLRALTQAGR